MPISTVPVTGSYVPPDGSTIVGGQIVFALSGPDTEGDTVVSGETIAELDGADLPVGFELWRNTEGERGTYYKVRARVYVEHSTPGGTFQTQRSYELGNVQVGDAVSYTLTELLNNPVPDEPGWNVNIDPTAWAELQADFDAADTAATNAGASAGAASGSATAAAGSATAAAASALAAAASADDASAAGAFAAAASDSADDAAGSASDAASEASAAAASAIAAAASEAAASGSASDAATDAGLALTRATAAAGSATAAAASAGAASGSATAASGSASAASGSATAAAASATAAAASAVTASAASGYANAAAASAQDAADEASAAQGYASDAAASAAAALASEGAANVDAAQAVSAANDAADSAADAEAAKVAAEAARDEIRELYVTLEDFGAVGDGVTPDNAAFAAAAAAGGDVWATQGKTYLCTVPQEVRGATDFCLRMDGATIQMAEGCNAVYRFYEYTNVGIDFGATGRLIGNYDTDGAWASFATTPGITSGSSTGTASTSYIATTTTITVNGLGVGYVKKGYRFSHINGGTTYAYIVTADAAITAGSATVTLDHGLEAPLTSGQLIYLNFWKNRWVVASAVGPTDTQITLEMANVTSADGNPRILAGTKFSFHDDYNNIDSIDYTKVCTVAIGGSVTGSYPTKTVTVTLTAPMGRSVPAGTMGTSIMDYYNNEHLPVLFYGGTGGFVRGANVSNLRLHGFGQACINAPWDGANPATKPNIDLKLEGNVDTSTNARGALCVAAWSTRGLTVCGNRGTYALGQLRSLVQVERSQGFKVKENSQYGGQYLCNTNGECSDGDISGNRGTHTMRMLRQGNTSTRLSFTRNIGIAHSSYTDWLMMVWSGMVDEDGAAAGNTALRLNSTTVGENEFSGATRTAGGYGSHIIIGPQNLNATLGETYWPRQVWVFGNRSTGATVHGIYGLNGDSVTYETNFIVGSGQAGIKLVGGDNSDLLSNEVLDCCTATPGKGIVLDGATNVKANGNKTTVDTGTGMEAGLSLVNGATLRGEDNNDWTGTVTSGGLSLMSKQSRADLAALASYGWRAASGQIVRGGDLDYVGSTGATAIADLPGLVPYGDITPQHFGGLTNAAVTAAVAYWATVSATSAGAQNPASTAKPLYFPAGLYNSGGATITITTPGTGAVIKGDGDASRLDNIALVIADYGCDIGDFKMTGGSYLIDGITVDPRGSNMRYGSLNNVTVRDRVFGFKATEDNAWLNINNCIFERNADGAILENTSGLSFDGCDFRLNTGRGMFLKNGGEVRATQCDFGGNGNHGLYIDASYDGDTTENYFGDCSFSNNQSNLANRDSFAITGAASNGAGGTTLTIGAHNLTEGMQGITIQGTTSYNSATEVFNVTNTTVDIAVAFVANETGTLIRPEWDIFVNGPSAVTPQRINDLFFGDCNMNFTKLKNCYNVSFDGCRLKEQLWLDGGCFRISRFGFSRGRQIATYKDVDISGQNAGFSELVQTIPNAAGFTSGDGGMVMRVPNASLALVGNKPSGYHYVQATSTSGVKISGASLLSGTALDGTGTLAGGAIVEWGSNANGTYCLHLDGRLECWSPQISADVTTASGSGYRSTAKTWTLPYAMVDTTYTVHVGTTANSTTHWGSGRATATTSCEVTLWGFVSNTGRGCRAYAVGKWK